jgi:release factor glutamine methyltransferase
MTLYEAQQRLVFQLYDIYDNREAANIADLVMEHITGWKKIDRILNKKLPLLPSDVELLEKYTRELLAYKPVQYVLNEAWFHGMKLYVDEHVLIPRPETEELVEWIKADVRSRQRGENAQPDLATDHLTIFDIGTGSGCISVALKKAIPFAEVYACDISKDALETARKNASVHHTDVGLLHLDFLDALQWEHLPGFDIIASNPPYIPVKDKETMSANVLAYEPHLALFVGNEDPLLFYRAIADFARQKLKPHGSIYAEIHEELSSAVRQLFIKKGFSGIELKKDMQGKNRMIKVIG